jgi:hypothetical protein
MPTFGNRSGSEDDAGDEEGKCVQPSHA